jgi:D-alanyl-D-alanine carboxypeptidase
MDHTAAAPRRARPALAALLVVAAALLGVVGYQSVAASSPGPSLITLGPFGQHPKNTALRDADGAIGKADGVVPDDVTVFDSKYPAVANLDPALLGALRRAARDAADDGVDFVVNSGWRSPRYQAALLDEAVSKYGSRAAAARWVATPSTSAHVAGDAVDIGHDDARRWLDGHGAAYGLCRVYANEPWHYEVRPDAVDHGCPRMYADPAHDPRMQQ